MHRPLARDLWIIGPQLLAGSGIEGEDLAPGRADIHDTVDHNRRRFLASLGIQIGMPGKIELVEVISLDLIQWTEALLAIGPSIAKPVVPVAVGVNQPINTDIHRGNLPGDLGRAGQQRDA